MRLLSFYFSRWRLWFNDMKSTTQTEADPSQPVDDTLSATGGTTSDRPRLLDPFLALAPRKRSETRERNRARTYRSTWLKHCFVYSFYWASRLTPQFAVRAGLSVAKYVLLSIRSVPGNVIRRACDDLAVVCSHAGNETTGRDVYRDFVDQLRHTGRLMHGVYHRGPSTAVEVSDISEENRKKVADTVRKHGGLLATVPHNLTAAMAGIGFSNAFDTLLIGKSGDSTWRADIANELFARMDVKSLFVRGKNPLSVSRQMIDAMTSGKVVVATVDSIYRKENRIEAKIFGGTVGFSPWAVRLAATAGIPIMPAYMHPVGDRIVYEFGEPLVSRDLSVLTQHYVDFFEKQIVAHPSSWAFLAHKRWRMILRQARNRIEAGQDLGAPFEVRSKDLRGREATD